jgi:hypothetical protein
VTIPWEENRFPTENTIQMQGMRQIFPTTPNTGALSERFLGKGSFQKIVRYVGCQEVCPSFIKGYYFLIYKAPAMTVKRAW